MLYKASFETMNGFGRGLEDNAFPNGLSVEAIQAQ